MVFLSIAHTDVGIKKSTNQDSVLIKEANTDYGHVLLSVVCDGMGGLAKGEVASAALIKAFSNWFEEEFPVILYKNDATQGIDYNHLQKSWNGLIDIVNHKIENYAAGFHTNCGTTLAACLMVKGHYYIVTVGDTRVYQITNKKVEQLTEDQTFVQRELKEGRMTLDEAKNHPQRNMLLQCVGASPVIIPEFDNGVLQENDVFILCSDGFRHVISEDEMFRFLNPRVLHNEQEMKNAAVYLTELNKQRRETDNISVIVVRCNAV